LRKCLAGDGAGNKNIRMIISAAARANTDNGWARGERGYCHSDKVNAQFYLMT
jgi:hypothetical protein